MGKKIRNKSGFQQNWSRWMLMGTIAAVISLMMGVLFQTAFYEITSNIPFVIRQDAHITLPLCNIFPDLHGCEAWVGTLFSIEIWELSQQVGQIGGMLVNLILVTLFSMGIFIRSENDSPIPGLILGVTDLFFSLLIALIIQLPLSISNISGVIKIILFILIPLCGYLGTRIGEIKLLKQSNSKLHYFSLGFALEKNDNICESLSDRELEVLVLVAEGYKNHEIAQMLFISIATVKTHLQHIFAKLGVSNRTAAVTQALSYGLIRQGIDIAEEER